MYKHFEQNFIYSSNELKPERKKNNKQFHMENEKAHNLVIKIERFVQFYKLDLIIFVLSTKS